jgi:hypothetical protein
MTARLLLKLSFARLIVGLIENVSKKSKRKRKCRKNEPQKRSYHKIFPLKMPPRIVCRLCEKKARQLMKTVSTAQLTARLAAQPWAGEFVSCRRQRLTQGLGGLGLQRLQGRQCLQGLKKRSDPYCPLSYAASSRAALARLWWSAATCVQSSP